MNAHMTSDEKHGAKRIRKLSNAELARFLNHLSALYRDEKTGNLSLSVALSELARGLSKSRIEEKQHDLGLDDPIRDALKNADFATLNDLLDDDALTKNDLIRIAIERFGSPRSKLARLTKEGVKSELKSAMLHEESLKIISQEAKRGGVNRVS